MPIEFDCPQCNNRLRVPDGSEGKPVLCPQCSLQFTIPEQNETEATSSQDTLNDESDSNPFATQPTDASSPNPYAAPTANTNIPPDGPQTSLTNSVVKVDRVFNETWAAFTENFGTFLLLGVMIMALYILSSLITIPFTLFAEQAEGVSLALFVQAINFLLGQVIGAFIAAVGFRYTLDVLSGSKTPFDRAFHVFHFMVPMVLTNIVILLIGLAFGAIASLPLIGLAFFGNDFTPIFIGLFAIAVAAIYFFVVVRLCLPLIFIIDRGQGVFESINSSLTYTKGNGLAIFLCFLALGIGGTAFTLVTCGIGLLAVIPIATIMLVVIYRLATGQPPRSQPSGPAA